MATFGENLRREREMRGVSLEEISAATKISSRFLAALENEEFAKLPGGIFTRGFIRAYAKYLGLDEDHVMAEYQLVASPGSELDLGRLAMAQPKARRGKSHASLYAILLAIGMLGAGYAIFQYSRRIPQSPSVVRPSPPPRSSDNGNTAAVPAAQAPVPATPAPGASEAGAGSSPRVEQTVPAPDYGFPAVESGLILQVAATERSWVAIDADDKTVLQRVLNPNEIQTLRAKNSFAVTLGNAQGVILTLNGETLKPLGRRGEVKSVRLTRDDLHKNSP
ncbi:MAG TPA: RodZ domain-containing protein [Terriglobia bacterium]|nr:RodZ domain-containing protein [Terriglobia bacterium]